VALQPKDSVIMSGYDRYQHFIDRLTPKYGQVDEQQLMEMIKRPVSMKSNLHCAIFHPATLELWVTVAATDGSPACNQPYYRFSLKDTQDPGSPNSEAKPAPTGKKASLRR
jgi:isopenicillin-N N-acyltransferase-like protein